MTVVEVAEELFDLETLFFGDVVAKLEDKFTHLAAVAAKSLRIVFVLSSLEPFDHARDRRTLMFFRFKFHTDQWSARRLPVTRNIRPKKYSVISRSSKCPDIVCHGSRLGGGVVENDNL